MAQIKPGNPRYRTKEEIAKDIVFILTASVSYGTKFAVLQDAMWIWTELNGKYEGCAYWTPLAMAKYAVNRKMKCGKYDGLRHEHIVPKRVVMKMIEEIVPPTPEAVFAICDKFLIGVVVTVEEDVFLNNKYQSSMPDEFDDVSSQDHHDPWLRYKRCNILWTTEDAARQAVVKVAPHLNL